MDGSPPPTALINPVRPPRSEVVLPPVQPPGQATGASGSATLRGAQFAAPAFEQYQADIAGTQVQVDRLRDLPRPQVQVLKDANRRLQGATAVFERNETQMSSRQRALAVFQLEIASDAVRTAVASSGVPPAAGVITRSQAVEASAAISADLESFSRSLASGRKPHSLKVVVRPGDARLPAPPLAVYVLPLGLFLYADTVEEAKLHYLIEMLKFAQPTSPAVGELERGVRYVVWVGPQHAAREMAQMVRTRAVSKYSTVHATASAEGAEVTFNESDQARVR